MRGRGEREGGRRGVEEEGGKKEEYGRKKRKEGRGEEMEEKEGEKEEMRNGGKEGKEEEEGRTGKGEWERRRGRRGGGVKSFVNTTELSLLRQGHTTYSALWLFIFLFSSSFLKHVN